MSATYSEHKAKYKKLKQASFVLSERLKRAIREMDALQQEKDAMNGTAQSQAAIQFEREVEGLQTRLNKERDELNRLEENA